jgi:uncharacterized membrane protein
MVRTCNAKGSDRHERQILSPRNSSDDVGATLGAAQDMPGDVTAAGNEPFWRVDIAARVSP